MTWFRRAKHRPRRGSISVEELQMIYDLDRTALSLQRLDAGLATLEQMVGALEKEVVSDGMVEPNA